MEDQEEVKVTFFLNLGFSIFGIIGGVLTHSVAIVSGAIHDFSDSLVIFLSLVLGKKKERKKIQLVQTFFSNTIFIVGSVLALSASFYRIVKPLPINFVGMLLFSLFGIAINGYATYKTSKSMNELEKKLNMSMVWDSLEWILIFIGALLIRITGNTIIDPFLAIIVTIVIMSKAYKNVTKTIDTFIGEIPKIDVEALEKKVKSINHVVEIYEVVFHSLENKEVLVSMHVVVEKSLTKKNVENLKETIRNTIKEFSVDKSTIEIEYNLNE